LQSNNAADGQVMRRKGMSAKAIGCHHSAVCAWFPIPGKLG
jgi:hypothetical protein